MKGEINPNLKEKFEKVQEEIKKIKDGSNTPKEKEDNSEAPQPGNGDDRRGEEET